MLKEKTMSKGRGSNRSKTTKPSVKVGDLKPKNDPKGGTLNFAQQMNIKGEASVVPSPELNFNTYAGKK